MEMAFEFWTGVLEKASLGTGRFLISETALTVLEDNENLF
jgi:hypothetical protein